MGFKVGDKVIDRCGVEECATNGKEGVVASDEAFGSCSVNFPEKKSRECRASSLELVNAGKLQESRLSEIVSKIEFKDSDPERVAKMFQEDLQKAAEKRGEGRKDDGGKLRWELLLGEALLPSVKSVLNVLMFGAKKYADDNWTQVPNARKRYYNALLRHLTDWKLGKKYDEDSGLPTLAHAACDSLFLLAFDLLDGVLPDGEKK